MQESLGERKREQERREGANARMHLWCFFDKIYVCAQWIGNLLDFEFGFETLDLDLGLILRFGKYIHHYYCINVSACKAPL